MTNTAVVTLHLPMPAHIAADLIVAVVNALAGHDLDGVMDIDEAGRPVVTARPSGPDQPLTPQGGSA